MTRRAAGMVGVGMVVLGLLLGACGTPSPARTASPTATMPPTPTATPMPTSGRWQSATNWPAAASAIVFAPSAPQTGYLCANLTQVPHTSSQWLYKTTDGGMTWTSVAGISTPAVTVPVGMSCSVFVDANDANDVFVQLLLGAAGPAGGEEPPVSETLWRSRDGGTTWQHLRMPQLFRGWVAISVVGTRIVALAAYGQQVGPSCDTNRGTDLYASDDGGQTWKTIGQDLISKGLSITDAGLGSATPGVQAIGTTLFVQTFCLTQRGAQQTYWRSTDNGNSWMALSLPAGIIEDMRFTPSPTGSFFGVAVVEKESGTGAQTTSLLLYSSDSGATWNALPLMNTLPGGQSSQFYVNATNIIALPDGSVLANIFEGSSPGTADSQLFVVHPQDATPTWQRYAPANGYDYSLWELASTSSGLVLWGWDSGELPKPVYLSPVP